MLSLLNLRFHKKLIETLKVRASQKNTSVNSLVERFLDDGLKKATASDEYFQLIADPEATVQQLYRHIMCGLSWTASQPEVLARELTTGNQEGLLAETLTGLRCLYGDR